MSETKHTIPLPQNWQWSNIGLIADIIMGQSPPGDSYNSDGIGVPLINGPVEFGPTPFSTTVKTKFTTLPTKFCKENDLILCVRGSTTGRMNIAGFDACIGRGVASLRAYIYQSYLNFYIHYNEFQLFQLGTGSTFPNISIDVINDFSIPIPPLAEQYRIVAKIEEIATKLDAGISSLKKAKAQLKQYRQIILKNACEGKLTKDWRLSNIDKNISQYSNDTFNLTDLPKLPYSWQYSYIEPLLLNSRKNITTGPFGSLLKKDDYKSEGVPVLGIENISTMKFIFNNRIFISEDKASDLSNYKVKPGDILISRSGTVGEVCVVPEEINDAIISTNLIKVSLNQNMLNPNYFCLLFNGSPFVLKQISDMCKGSTRDFLNQTILKSIIFPIPLYQEQKVILNKVETLYSIIDNFSQTIDSSLIHAETLRHSILAQAFSGKLVPQNPNDEPAEKLLERIRAERAQKAVGKPSPAGKRRSRQTVISES